MTTVASPSTPEMDSLSEAFVAAAHAEMSAQLPSSGKMHVQVARDIFYRHGLIPTDDEVFHLIKRIRRYATADKDNSGLV